MRNAMSVLHWDRIDSANRLRFRQGHLARVVFRWRSARVICEQENDFLLGLFEEQFVTGNEVDPTKSVR